MPEVYKVSPSKRLFWAADISPQPLASTSVYERIPCVYHTTPRVYHAYTMRIPCVYHADTTNTTRIPRVYHAYTTQLPAYTSVYQRIPCVYRAYTTQLHAYTVHIPKPLYNELALVLLDPRLGHVAIHMLGL